MLLYSFVDRERKLLESYRTVDFVKIPDWENETLFATQIAALQATIALRVREQSDVKAKNGTLFNDQVWFDILDKVVENFLQEENISMSRIFGKFIISESSLVNRAYAFFHHVYGTSTKKEFFLSAREQSIKMIAAHVVFRACEKGHGALRDIDGTNFLFFLLDFLKKISTRRELVEIVLQFTATYSTVIIQMFISFFFKKKKKNLKIVVLHAQKCWVVFNARKIKRLNDS